MSLYRLILSALFAAALAGLLGPFAHAQESAQEGRGGRLRTAAVKIALRRAERKATDPKQRAAVAKVLANDELLDAVTEELQEQHAAQKGGKVTDFLSWLLDNSDRILAVVMKIIALFSVNDQPAVTEQYVTPAPAKPHGFLRVLSRERAAALLRTYDQGA